MKKNSLSSLRYLPVIFVMGGIFITSHLPSSKLPNLEILDMDKILHAVAYAILAMSAIFAVLPLLNIKSSTFLAIAVTLFCLIYGVSDELHQSFIPSRMASIWDVLADFFGAALASLAWHLCRWDKYLPNSLM